MIIPAPNVRHLSLSQAILDAVEQEQFAIWAIEGIEDALPLLTNLVWDGEGQTTLMQTIQSELLRRHSKMLATVIHGRYAGWAGLIQTDRTCSAYTC